MDWVGETCIGLPYYESFNFIENTCKTYDIRYQVADMDTVVRLLDECYPVLFSKQTTNYCSPYLEGAIRYAMKIPEMTSFDTWIGPAVECEDSYGNTGPNCAWFGRFYTRIVLPTEFNLLKSSGTYASALASGICMRKL